MERESEILRTLNDNVQHVPKYLYGDDAQDLFQDCNSAKWQTRCVDVDLARRVHRFLLADHFGKPISHCQSSRDMLQAVHHAFIAHREAYEKCGILHPDINDNNVRFRMEGGVLKEGILADWDLAIRPNPESEPQMVRTRYRTGTWYFMSMALLPYPCEVHGDLRDGFESFFYLVLYVTFRYLPTTIPPRNINSHVERIFGTAFYRPSGRINVGGDGKLSMIMNGLEKFLLHGFQVINDKPLTDWINSVLFAFRGYIIYGMSTSLAGVAGMQSIPRPTALSNHKFISEQFEAAHTEWSRIAGADHVHHDLNANETQRTPARRTRSTKRDIGDVDSPESPKGSKAKLSSDDAQRVA